jgi:DHA2 family multidrug resistance protein
MAFAMLTAGRLMTRTDPRLMLAFGLACCTVSLYDAIGFAPDTTVRTIVWLSLLQGFGLGLPLRAAQHRCAIISQAGAADTGHRDVDFDPQSRQLDRRLRRDRQPHQQDDPHARPPGRERHAFQSGAGRPAAAMLDPGTEMGRALLEQIMTQQATIIAYANDFKLMTILAFPLIPLIRVRGLGLRPAAATVAD